MSKYPVNSYIPTKVDKVYDLHSRLNKDKYDKILNDLDYHFKNCFVTNFDLINHERRGDKLEYSKKFYQTVFYDQVKKNIDIQKQDNFYASAIKSERRDIYFDKETLNEHFKRDSLESRGIFLSSMRKKFFGKTDDCKSLKF